MRCRISKINFSFKTDNTSKSNSNLKMKLNLLKGITLIYKDFFQCKIIIYLFFQQ